MGSFTVKIQVGNTLGGDLYEVEALVDTGATHTVLPDAFLKQMSIETPYVCDVRIGGDLVQEWSMGIANIAYNGRMRPCQVLASPAGEEYLLGATTLETLGFLVDPIAQVLVPTTTRV